jgi:hypothetical protein
MLISSYLAADTWEQCWIAGIEDLHHENYISAENHLNATIRILEDKNDNDHPAIYMDRARLFQISHQFEHALSDIDKAISSGKLKNNELVKAVSMRVSARAQLGFSEGFENDIEFLAKNFEVQVENTEKYLILRNLSKSHPFRKKMTSFFIDAGICTHEEDIKELSSDVCIVNKTGKQIFDAVEFNRIRFDPQVNLRCQAWCDANAIAAIPWCVNYPEICLVNACNSAINQIQINCHTCCQNGFTQDVCSLPFGDILTVMQIILKSSSCGCQ